MGAAPYRLSPDPPILAAPPRGLHDGRSIALGGQRNALLGLGQVLVRRTVAVVRQRRALARRPAPRGRAALQAVRRRPRREVLLRERHVAVDDLVDAELLLKREVDAHVAEQRLGRPREVVPLGRQPRDGGLTRSQDPLVMARSFVTGTLLQDERCELTIDRAAEAIHRSPLGPPSRGPAA